MVRPMLSKRPRKLSMQELIDKGQENYDQYRLDIALKYFEHALVKNPMNSEVLDKIGEIATELDLVDRASQAFEQSIRISPERNPSKWLYAAQLSTGEKSLEYTKNGINYLMKELEASDSQTEEAVTLKTQICQAFCALGELYMTDLCDAEDAETRCEEAFLKALDYNTGLAEPIQSMANLRLTQNRKDEALLLLQQTYELIMSLDEASMPPMEFRIFTGKLLIEVGKHDLACDVLEDVLQEDDENAEIWFLVGSCHEILQESEAALEDFETCLKLLLELEKKTTTEFHLCDQLKDVESRIQALQALILQHPQTHDSDEEME